MVIDSWIVGLVILGPGLVSIWTLRTIAMMLSALRSLGRTCRAIIDVCSDLYPIISDASVTEDAVSL